MKVMLSDFTGADRVYIVCGYTDLRSTQKSRVKAEKTKIFFQKASSGFGDVSFK